MNRNKKILFSTLLASILLLGAVQSPKSGEGLNGGGGLSETGDAATRVVAETVSGTGETSTVTETVRSTEGTINVAETLSAATENVSTVATEPAPELIELSGGSAYARTILNNNGLASDRVFSSVRYVNTTRHAATADSNSTSWGWPTVYLGVSDDNYVDLSQATDLSIELKAFNGPAPWIKWRAVDADGTVARVVDYGNLKGDLTQLDTGTTFDPVDKSGNNWKGTWIDNDVTGSTSITGVVLHSDIANDWVVDAATGDYVSGADGTFDKDKVVALMVSVSAYYEMTLDIGSVRVTIGEQESVLWDADNAKQKSYAEVFTEETKAFSNFDLDQNEWYFGAVPVGITNDPSAWNEKTLSATYAYKDDKALEYTYVDGATDAWVPLYEDNGLNYVKNETTMDLSACNAMVFDADFTGANGTSAIDFMIRPKDASGLIKYKSTGRAFLIAENGTLTTCGGNAYPAGFKGKVILPFTSFQKEGETSVLLSDCEYLNNVQYVTAIVMSTRSDTYQADDTVKLNNIQMLKKSEQELNILDSVAAFRLTFKMQTTAELCYEPFGIRFGVTAGNKVYEEVVGALDGVSSEFGMIIVPDTDDYASAMPNQANILTVKKEVSGEVSEDTYWYSWYAGIKQIGKGACQIKFVARAYLQYELDGKTYTVWATTAVNGVSLYDLATEAKANGVSNESVDAVIAYVDGNQ